MGAEIKAPFAENPELLKVFPFKHRVDQNSYHILPTTRDSPYIQVHFLQILSPFFPRVGLVGQLLCAFFISGLKETFIKKYIVEMTNTADIRPEEQSQKAEICREK